VMTEKHNEKKQSLISLLKKFCFNFNVSSFTCEKNGGHRIWYIKDFVCSKRGHNSPKFSLRVAKKID
jgi:hypothetical protein